MLSGARRAKDREQVDGIIEQANEHVQLGIDALRGLVTELRPRRWTNSAQLPRCGR